MGFRILITALLVAGCQALTVLPPRGTDGKALPWNASVNVDLGDRLEMSPVLYGIFFEEVGCRNSLQGCLMGLDGIACMQASLNFPAPRLP